jgi:N-acetylneuraminate lyase
MKHIEGLITATHTPMTKNGDLNLEVIPSYYAFLKRNSIKGIFLNGSTSEGYHMTTEERKLSLEAWSNAVNEDNDFKIFVFVGHLSTRDACSLAEHASGIKNVHGISATAPFYQKPATLSLLIDLCKDIAQCAPSLPFYYYHIPVLTNVNFQMSQFLPEAAKQIANLQGVKYTNNDLEDYLVCKNLDQGKYEMLAGIDEIALASKAFGAKGYIGSTYNFMAPLYQNMFDSFDSGDGEKAQSLQLQAIQIIRTIAGYGFVSASKFIMRELGIDNGYVRLPSKQITETEFKELSSKLKALGFYDICSTHE